MRKKTMIIGGAALAAVLVLGGTGIAYAVTDGFEGPDDHTVSSSTLQLQSDQVRSDDDDRDDRDDRDDDDRTGGDDAAPASGAPTSTDPDDLKGDELARASEAALAAAEGDGGVVTEAERSDDPDHAFEVEVTFADGTDVDVELDESFGVLRVQP